MSNFAAGTLQLLAGRIEQVVDEISDDNFQKRPGPNLNPAVWLLGHLVVSMDAVSKFVGEPYHVSMDWHDTFNGNSTPFENKTPYPTKAELMTEFKATVARAITQIAGMTDEQKAAPHGIEALTGSPVQTAGDMTELLLTGHIGWHLGHLEWCQKLFAA